ncbi:hypothetical protein F5Y10DRAFT_249235 [Nemania abortiva]|nr:hypothetical protein F5Y10DRAFT_249235 [Nemania abortiva]
MVYSIRRCKKRGGYEILPLTDRDRVDCLNYFRPCKQDSCKTVYVNASSDVGGEEHWVRLSEQISNPRKYANSQFLPLFLPFALYELFCLEWGAYVSLFSIPVYGLSVCLAMSIMYVDDGLAVCFYWLIIRLFVPSCMAAA